MAQHHTPPLAPCLVPHLGLLGALARGSLLQARDAFGLLAHVALGLLRLALLLLLHMPPQGLISGVRAS